MIERLRRLMFLRVVIATFLLGIAAFIQIKGTESLPVKSIIPVYLIIIAIYICSFLFFFLAKKIKTLETNVKIQVVCDLILITCLVYVTGGIDSVYSVLYPLVIIYSSLFLTRRWGLLVASISSLLYGLLLDLQYYNVIHPIWLETREYNYSAGYVLSRIFIQIVSLYIIAFLVSFIVEKEKKTRALLQEKEGEFYQLDLLHKSIIESVNSGIITIDLNKKIKAFNRAAKKITGFSFPEVAGRGIDNVLSGFSARLEKAETGKGAGYAIDRDEIRVSDRQGREIVLGFSVSALVGQKDNIIGHIVIFQDLSVTKELEREVEAAKRLALIGEMSAGLAHEIRNPLTALSGSIQMLKANLHLSASDERLMGIILRGREQLENLVKNFLLLSRPDKGDYEEMNINGILDDIIESIRQCPDWHEGIRAEKHLYKEAGVYGNKTEICEVLWNLVLNAVQAMPEGGILKIETGLIQGDNGREYTEIRINDTGCGIDKKSMDNIFTPFFSTKDRGTGLGLPIVNRIVAGLEGEIKIASEMNKGTQCKLLLPKNIH
ncbi:MAG: PAS domain S-box protein [Desulfobacterales bacterium]|nr:PAS domain S-box protein [Desulfobacterales bacterium]